MRTAIEWAEYSWNVTAGCRPISKACIKCYAKWFAWRHAHNPKQGDAYKGIIEKSENGLQWTGQQNLLSERLEQPYHWRKGRLIFINSMADLFYKTPCTYLDQVFDVIRNTPQHFYLILTKYVGRMRYYMTDGRYNGMLLYSDHWPLPNVGLGVTVEHSEELARINNLLRVPDAALYFVNYGPALGPIAWPVILDIPLQGINTAIKWLIAEGQSGPKAEPSHPSWFRNARDGCIAAGVPFFFKGWGAWSPHTEDARPSDRARIVGVPFRDDTTMYRMSKGRAGAVLDGQLYREYPKVIKRHFEGQN